MYCELTLVLDGYMERQKAEMRQQGEGRKWMSLAFYAAMRNDVESLRKLLGVKAKKKTAWTKATPESAEAAARALMGEKAE